MERGLTKEQFKSNFARKIAEMEDSFETDKLPVRSVDSARKPKVQPEPYVYGSVGTLHSLRREEEVPEEWVSPQKFRDFLDRKERDLSYVKQQANIMPKRTNSPSRISRVKTVVCITPTKETVEQHIDTGDEDGMVRLERENLELKKQLERLGRGCVDNRDRGCSSHEGDSRNYVKLKMEVERLQNTVRKMENSKTMYESSTKQLVNFLEAFASQLAVDSPQKKLNQENENFDSLLSRPTCDLDSFRPSLSSCNTFISRPSTDSFYTLPSRPGVDLVNRAYMDMYRPGISPVVSSYSTLVPSSSYSTLPAVVSSYSTLPPRAGSNLYTSAGSYSRLPDITQSHRRNVPGRCGSLDSVLSSRNINDLCDEGMYSLVQGDEVLYNAVQEDKVLHNAVQGDEVVYNAVQEDQVLYNAVQEDKVLYNAVQEDKLVYNAVQGVTVRNKILMGSSSVKSIARRTSSSVDLVKERSEESHLSKAASTQDLTEKLEKKTLQGKSKSLASGLSNGCRSTDRENVKFKQIGRKRGEGKVQKFLKQMKSFVSKDKPKLDKKKRIEAKEVLSDDHSFMDSTLVKVSDNHSTPKHKSHKLNNQPEVTYSQVKQHK